LLQSGRVEAVSTMAPDPADRWQPVPVLITKAEDMAQVRRMPGFLRPLVSGLMPRIGPKGLEFARARVEMQAIETVLRLRQHAPRRLKLMVPDHVRALVTLYGLVPQQGEESER
jgi:coenzyme F420 hydrogenase subunit beta